VINELALSTEASAANGRCAALQIPPSPRLAKYYPSLNGIIDFEVRKRDERRQSQVLVSGKALWLGLGATDNLAGMGVLYIVAFHIHL